MKRQGFFLALFFLFLNISLSAQDFDLIPYRIGDQWGFSDVEKTIIIEARYDELIPFSDGYSVFKQKDKHGIITTVGKEIETLAFDSVAGLFHVYSFYDKIAKKSFTDTAVGVYINQKQVYINCRGELVKGEPETGQIAGNEDLSRSEKGL
jgi:hypothetical protein